MPQNLLLILSLVAAVGSADVPIERTMNGQSVTVHKGQRLTIKLPSNRTTGYTWQVASLPRVLKASGTTYAPIKTTPGLAGSGGTEQLRFSAARSGAGTLRLVYRRPWEKGQVRLADTFKLNVTVR